MPAELHKPQPSPAKSSRRVHPLVWILLAGALVRVGLWYAWGDWSPLINDDARDYQGLAVRLVTTGQYANERGHLSSLRPPLYPAMIAGIYHLFGITNDDAVRAIQAAAALLTVLLVYRVGVITYSRQVGLWAAALACFYPSLLGYANLLLSETFFTFFVVAVTWLPCEAIHRQRAAILIPLGIALGLGALTRSILLLFAPVLALFLLLSWRGGWGRRVVAAGLPLIVFAVVIAPWAVRNTRLQQTFTIIDVMGGRNAMMGNYEYTPMERSWATISDVPEERQWHRILHKDRKKNTPLTQGQVDKLALRHAIDFVRAHPGLTLQRDLVKFFNFWQLDRLLVAAATTGYFGTMTIPLQALLAAVVCGAYAVILLAAIFGACCYPPSDSRYHWFLIASILFPCAIHTLVFAHSRYHLPIVPLLSIYAAAAIVHFRELDRRRRTWGFRLAVTLCVVITLGWLRELVFVDFDLPNQLLG